MSRRGTGLLGFVVVLAIALIVGVLAYNAGVAAGMSSATSGDTTGPIVYPPFGFGFGFFGLLLTIVLIGLLIAALRGPRGWGGYRGHASWGPGAPWWRGPGGGEMPRGAEEMLASWHRSAHGESSDESRTSTGTRVDPS
jgi:hypothetical protein